MAAYRPDSFSLTGAGEAEQLRGEMVSADFFSILGVKPVLGRMFTAQEDQLGAGRVVLVTSGFWKRKLGSSPDILGRRVVLDGEGYTVIGVIPASFHLLLPNFRDNNELYVPIGQWSYPYFRDRSYALGMKGIGRLKPGVTLAQARADMDSVAQNLAAAFPQADAGEGAEAGAAEAEDDRRHQAFSSGAASRRLLCAPDRLRKCRQSSAGAFDQPYARIRHPRLHWALAEDAWSANFLPRASSSPLGGAGLGLLLATWGTRAALTLLPVTLPRAERSRN